MKQTPLLLFGFLVFICLTLTPAQAVDCATLWANGFPDLNIHGRIVPCEEFRPNFTAMTPDMKLFISSELATSEPVKLQMEQIAEAVQYSANKYRSLGRVPRISLVRYPRPHYAEAAAFGYTFVQFFDLNTEACPILIYRFV